MHLSNLMELELYFKCFLFKLPDGGFGFPFCLSSWQCLPVAGASPPTHNYLEAKPKSREHSDSKRIWQKNPQTKGWQQGVKRIWQDDKTPRFKSLISQYLFILIVYSWLLVDEVTWPNIWESVQYIIKTKTTLGKARQIQSSTGRVSLFNLTLSY